MNAIEIKDLVKIYDETPVVNKLSFKVPKGIVFGLLGPNGAGKTTTLEMIEGLRKPTSGHILVNGLDNQAHINEIKTIIGVQLQSSILDERIKVREALELFASYYPKSMAIDPLLQIVNLSEKKNDFQKNLSGGQRQRLALALCLINDPEIVFLDEPTTGLDPQARRNLWDSITRLKSLGKTVILTTHYMDEAEKLCDDIAVIDQGKIIAQGSPATLIETLDSDTFIELSIDQSSESIIHGLTTATKIELLNGDAKIYTKRLADTLEELIQFKQSLTLDSLHVRKATLEDVFIHLTGRSLRE